MKNVFKAALFMLVLIMSAVAVTANPVITPIADQTVNEGSLLKIDIASTAPSIAPSTFAICQATVAGPGCIPAAVSQLPISTTIANFSKISDTAAQFNWTPSFTQAGTYLFNVSVSDADSNTSDAFTVTVTNLPPRIGAPAQLVIGGENQERSNPNHETDSRQEINATATLTITNSGEPLTGLTGAVAIASGFSANDVMVNFTLPKASLATGESISFPVSVRVPQQLDAVNNALSPTAFTVASLTFSAIPTTTTVPVTATTALDVRAENNLRIKSLKVRFGDQSDTVSNGDTVQDMKPGNTVELEIQVENRFRAREDVTIEDIEVNAISGSNLDIDEFADVGDLAVEETETVTLTSVIDSDADDGTFDVEITVDGTDEFGARHGEKWIIGFEVKRKSHEIEITGLTLDPQTVSCERQSTLLVDIKNSGRRDEDAVFVRVAAPELSFGAVSDKLSLNRDDEESLAFNIPVPATVARPANYRVTVDTFYNTDTKSNSDAAILSVQACQPAVVTPPAQPKENVTVITIPPPVTNVTAPPAAKPFFRTPQYIVLLVLGYLAVIGGGAALIVKMLRRQ